MRAPEPPSHPERAAPAPSTRRPRAKVVLPLVLAAAVLALGTLAWRRSRADAPRDGVLFVCEHGAAKSVIAATYFNELAASRGLRARATARGAEPQDAPSVATVKGLRADGLAPVVERPLPLLPADLKASAVVVGFDCGAPSMTAFADSGACWNDVPTVSDDYARARDSIRARVQGLVDDEARRANGR